ncbi:acyltransferase family protein [Aliarcobacter lanthieri]|uniref:acyltransferase family protein n=1 Tax=Aliarcobacter lanthieri TaxID=1355374 RepID=UPI003AAB32E2
MKYLIHLDGIRAIAVIAVILFHLNINLFNGGFIGVDIFFVISGFLITQKIKCELEINKSFNFKNFYFKRIQRLVPALIFTFLLSSIFAIIIMSPTHLKSFGQSLYSAVLGFSNIYFYHESDYFNISSYLKPLLHTWSLSVEFQFYLFYPIFIYIINRIYKLNLKLYLVLFLIFILINIFFTLNLVDKIDELSKAKMFFLLQFRVFEFILGGILVFIISYEFKQKFVYDILFLVGLLFIGYAIYTFDEKLLYPSYYALVPTLGTVFLIYSGLHTKFKFLLTNRLIVFIGLISYSIYLVHWPIIVFYEYIVGNLNINDKFIILFLTLILGYFSYRYIENSFRKTIFTKKYFITIFLFILSISVLGFSMKYFDGWKWRIEKNQITNKILLTDNYHKDFYGGAGYSSNGFISNKKNKNSINILLMGDSHGKHYVDGILKIISSKYNYSFYNASGYSCIHLPNFIRPKTHPLCQERLENTLKILNKNTKTLVIISHSWISQMNRSAIVDNNGKIIKDKISYDDILKGILELKSEIGGNELLVIGQVPTTGGFDLYDIFSRPSFFQNNKFNKYLKTVINEEYKDFNLFLKKASFETKQFYFLDPFSILCDNSECINIDDNYNLIYSDRGHLSIYGSHYLIKGFEKEMLAILKILNKEKR